MTSWVEGPTAWRVEAVVLAYGRVRLEPWRSEHDAPLLKAAQDDDVWRWLPVRRPRTVHEMGEFRQSLAGLSWAVFVDGVPAGCTSYLNIDPEVRGLEVGATWYRRDLWSTEINPTCKYLLLRHAFEHLEAQRITLRTDARNLRSQAAIRKLGAQFDGTLRHDRRRADGSVRDSVLFSVLATEWPQVRAGLEGRVAGSQDRGQP